MENSSAKISTNNSRENIDWMLFGVGSSLLFLVVLVIVIFADWSIASIDRLYQSVATTPGSLFIYAAVLTLGFPVIIAISQ